MDEACLGIPLYFMPACRDEMSMKYPELAPKLKWDDSMWSQRFGDEMELVVCMEWQGGEIYNSATISVVGRIKWPLYALRGAKTIPPTK